MSKNPSLMEYLIHLAFLLVYAGSTNGQVQTHIKPSQNILCPQLPCLTLQQFAANSSGYHENDSVFLNFLPGNHILDRELSLAYVSRVSMTMETQENGSVIVQCVNQSTSLNISETTFVSIFKLHFIGCGSNQFTNVDELLIEDTIFQGGKESGPTLILTAVSVAGIVKCLFVSNIPLCYAFSTYIYFSCNTIWAKL